MSDTFWAAHNAHEHPLIAVGHALAEIAEPNKDLLSFAGETAQLKLPLEWIAAALDRAYDRMADARTADERDEIERAALDDAGRALQRVLVSVAQLAGEIALAKQRIAP